MDWTKFKLLAKCNSIKISFFFCFFFWLLLLVSLYLPRWAMGRADAEIVIRALPLLVLNFLLINSCSPLTSLYSFTSPLKIRFSIYLNMFLVGCWHFLMTGYSLTMWNPPQAFSFRLLWDPFWIHIRLPSNLLNLLWAMWVLLLALTLQYCFQTVSVL